MEAQVRWDASTWMALEILVHGARIRLNSKWRPASTSQPHFSEDTLISPLDFMLRLRPSLRLNLSVRKQSINSLARRLIPVTGDFESAQREAKWLREDCQKTAAGPEQESLLEQYVSRRSKGEPLQYILGSTYFNDLEIKCRPGVFIPRYAPLYISFQPIFIN